MTINVEIPRFSDSILAVAAAGNAIWLSAKADLAASTLSSSAHENTIFSQVEMTGMMLIAIIMDAINNGRMIEASTIYIPRLFFNRLYN